MAKRNPLIQILLTDTYLAVIKKSVGARMFQDIFALIDGKRRNVTRGGVLSCAFFVSGILTIAGLIKEIHGTVDATVRDMELSQWKRQRTPKRGDVLVWEKQNGHRHIGFYIGNHRAVSNSTSKRYPVAHHWTFGSVRGKPKRRIEEIWRSGREGNKVKGRRQKVKLGSGRP